MKTPKFLLMLSHWLKEKGIKHSIDSWEHSIDSWGSTIDIDNCGFISTYDGEWAIWWRDSYDYERLYPEKLEFLRELELDIRGEIRHNKSWDYTDR